MIPVKLFAAYSILTANLLAVQASAAEELDLVIRVIDRFRAV
jgi:hypothetical protein